MKTAVLAVVTVVVAGCLSPRSDPSQFFLLTPTTERAASSARELSLGVGPVTFPTYLDRPQMVTRLGPNQVAISEADRWAESLQDNFTGALARNLAVMAGTERVITYPWYNTVELDYAVSVNVLSFERDSLGVAHVRVLWELTDGTTGEGSGVRETSLTEAAASSETSASVAALSRGLEMLSREIVAAIQAR
jgi:uncharacterized lipoprotein YmbA